MRSKNIDSLLHDLKKAITETRAALRGRNLDRAYAKTEEAKKIVNETIQKIERRMKNG